MAADDNGDERKSFDGFELLVAMLLGMGAVGGAWSAWQGDLWGGVSAEAYDDALKIASEAYAEASNIATKASTTFNLGMTVITRDAGLDIRAKELVLEGLTSRDKLTKERTFLMAKYLYTQQISDEAYAALGYPPEFRTADKEKAASMPDAVLVGGLDKELDAAYLDKVLDAGTKKFLEAEARFAKGRADSAARFEEGTAANDAGDKFGLAGVLFTVALFLAGIALVFRSGVRWMFFVLGLAVLGASAAYLYFLPWAQFVWPWAS